MQRKRVRVRVYFLDYTCTIAVSMYSTWKRNASCYSNLLIVFLYIKSSHGEKADSLTLNPTYNCSLSVFVAASFRIMFYFLKLFKGHLKNITLWRWRSPSIRASMHPCIHASIMYTTILWGSRSHEHRQTKITNSRQKGPGQAWMWSFSINRITSLLCEMSSHFSSLLSGICLLVVTH